MDNSPLMAMVIEAIGMSAAGLEKSAALEASVEAQREKVAGFIPRVIDALQAAQFIRANEKEAMARHLADHANALATLHELCRGQIAAAEKAAASVHGKNGVLGTSDDGAELAGRLGKVKTAGAQWLGKRQSEEGAADRQFRETLMNFSLS